MRSINVTGMNLGHLASLSRRSHGHLLALCHSALLGGHNRSLPQERFLYLRAIHSLPPFRVRFQVTLLIWGRLFICKLTRGGSLGGSAEEATVVMEREFGRPYFEHPINPTRLCAPGLKSHFHSRCIYIHTTYISFARLQEGTSSTSNTLAFS